MPQERITALKKDETAVEMTDLSEKADEIIQKAEAPPQMYPKPSQFNNPINVYSSLFLCCTAVLNPLLLNRTYQGSISSGACPRCGSGWRGAAKYMGPG